MGDIALQLSNSQKI